MNKKIKWSVLLLLFVATSGLAQDAQSASPLIGKAQPTIDSQALQSDQTPITPAQQTLSNKQSAKKCPVLTFIKGNLKFGLKTNILSWIGVTPEFKYTLPTPNLTGEVFFLERWSAEFGFSFANFKYGTQPKRWGVAAYRIEPRFWLKADNQFHEWYFGVYTQLGDFNTQGTRDGNYTGTYVQAGISAGYFLPITEHFGAEFGLRGGYHSARVTPYDITPGHHYRSRTSADGNRIGLTGINLGLNWRF